MPLVTFFSVVELPEKNRKGGCNNPPPLVRRGLMLMLTAICNTYGVCFVLQYMNELQYNNTMYNSV